MPAIPVGTITLYYESHGKGDPLVLLPDLGNDVTSLAGQIPFLSESFHCVAIDNRGVGRSSKPSMPYTTKLMAEDAFNVLAAIGVDQCSVLGISMGGAIAQEMAIMQPKRVKKLIILGGWAKADRYLISLFELLRDVKRSVDPLTFDREIALWSFSRAYFDNSFEELDRRQRAALDVPYPTPHNTFTRQAEACMAHDTIDRLREIKASTLLLVGKEDILTPRRFTEQMGRKIRKSEIVEVEGAAHAAYLEQVDAVNKLVRDHLTA